MDDSMRSDRQFLCRKRSGDGRCVAAEVSTELASSITLRLVLAFISLLLTMDLAGFRQMRAARLYQMTFGKILLDAFLEILFDTTDLKARHGFTVRKLGQPIFVAGNTGEFFNMRIPWLDIFVAYGPVDGKSVARGSFKIVITPPLSLARPQQRFSSHVITAYPSERFFLDEWLFVIFDSPVHCFLAHESRELVVLALFKGNGAPVFKLPWRFPGSGIVLDVFDVTSALENECL